MSTTPIEALFIDWAGTISVPLLNAVIESAHALGITPDDLGALGGAMAGYFTEPDSLIHQAERGEIHDDELRAYLHSIVPGAGALFDGDPPSIFHAPDRPEMIELMQWCAERGLFVVLTTNNFATAQDTLASRYLDTGLVCAIVNSALIGLRKPDPAYFDLILETFELDAEAVLFIDDHQENVDAAALMGMATILAGDDTDVTVQAARTIIESRPVVAAD